jgi:hypothetical protein
MMKSEPQHLGKNDAANGPFPYRTTPNLGKSDWVYDDGELVVKPEEVAHNNGTRTGRNERKVV